MRKIITETVAYTFDELSDEAKEKAVENLWDINVDCEWWGGICEEVENIGCKITDFDINRGNYIDFTCTSPETTAEKILSEHGDSWDTYKLAKMYLKDRDKLIDEAPRDDDGEFENEYELDNQLDYLDEEFITLLGEEYLSTLRKEYEYLTSEAVIIETIQINEYELTSKGELI